MPETAPALRCEAMTVRYGDFTAVDAVSLSFEPGELVAILGPNGAGKSTLLKALVDARMVSSGQAYLGGRPVSGIGVLELAQRVAAIPEDTWLPFSYTVLEVVLMGRAPYLGFFGLEQAGDFELARAALERTEAGHLTHRSIETLSGGERQRVYLARALAQDTPVVLLDEPTAHLDIGHQQMALRLLSELAQEDRLVITVLHDLNLASAWCPRLVLMDGGAVVADGPAEAVLTSERLGSVYRTEVQIVPHPVSGRPMVLPTATGASVPVQS